MKAFDAFGGKERLASRLFELIREFQGPSRVYFADADPVAELAKISCADLLDWMFTEGINLGDAMELEWTSAQREGWLSEMQKRGAAIIGSDGSVDGVEFTLSLLIRLEALGELCGPPRELPQQDLQRLMSLRSKYRDLLEQPS